MKKIIATLAAVVIAAGMCFAQDLSQAVELYNNGAAARANGENEAALEAFNQAYKIAETLGEEGKELAGNCKVAIPDASLAIAKGFARESDFDNAIAKLKETVGIAKKFEAAEIEEEASKLLPQIIIQKGNGLIKTDAAAAAAAYKEALELDPENGAAALRLGQALNASGDFAGAVEAFNKAAENGQEANAKKQLSTIHLKKASAALKTKNYSEAVDMAVKANEYSANPQALQIAGQASQLAGKTDNAIKYFTQYLEAAPTAKNAGQIAYTVGALYQQAKNIAKAKEYYKMALSDPKFGPEAQKLLDTLK